MLPQILKTLKLIDVGSAGWHDEWQGWDKEIIEVIGSWLDSWRESTPPLERIEITEISTGRVYSIVAASGGPMTLYNIKEQDSIARIVLSVWFALVKVFFLLEVVFLRIDIVIVDRPRKVWLFYVGFRICRISIGVTGLIFGIKAAFAIGIIVRKEVSSWLTSPHVNLT